MNEMLEQVINRNDTWRGRHSHFQGQFFSANSDLHNGEGLSTGYTTLDTQLQLSEQGRWQVFIAPPYIPYAPLLAARGIDTKQVLLVHPQNRQDLLWSTEQALRSTTSSAVFSWLGAHQYSYSELRKLQLTAASGDSLAVMFRPNQAAHNHSPASLRLQMREYRKVHILKQRGGNQSIDVALPPSEDVPQQPQLWELPTWPSNGQQDAVLGAASPVA